MSDILFVMEIECEFAKSVIGLYSCFVDETSITENNAEIISFKGEHKPGKTNEDVESVFIAGTIVEYFPRNLQKFFPNLRVLTITRCGLKEICRDDLVGLEKLEVLDLKDNKLRALPDDLFVGMPMLKKINFNENQIEFASGKLLEPIIENGIEYFKLQKNKRINTIYEKSNTSRRATIQKFMKAIDTKCKPPSSQGEEEEEQAEKEGEPETTTKDIAAAKSEELDAMQDDLERDLFDFSDIRTNYNEFDFSFLDGFNQLRKARKLVDYVIIVGKKEFWVHKTVLAAHSSVFLTMFEDTKINRCVSKQADLSAEIVEAFLDYFYELKIPAREHAVEIYKLASKYEVHKLKYVCEDLIYSTLDASNALEIFTLATGQYKSEILKTSAFSQLQNVFGAPLKDELIEQPEKLKQFVHMMHELNALMNN